MRRDKRGNGYVSGRQRRERSVADMSRRRRANGADGEKRGKADDAASVKPVAFKTNANQWEYSPSRQWKESKEGAIRHKKGARTCNVPISFAFLLPLLMLPLLFVAHEDVVDDEIVVGALRGRCLNWLSYHLHCLHSMAISVHFCKLFFEKGSK